MARGYAQEKERMTRNLLTRVLKRHEGNRTHAAQELRIDSRYLRRLIKRYGLK